MTRTCAYPACHTGCSAYRRINKTNNSRNKSLFRFPKMGSPQRKQWEEVIGRVAKDHEVICEDHFPTNKIIKDYKIILPNGNVDVINRGVTRLRSDAVPFFYMPVPLPEHDYARKNTEEDDRMIKQENESKIVKAKPQNNINNIQQNIALNNLKNVEINQEIVNETQNNIPALIPIDKQHPPPLIWRLPADNNPSTKISSKISSPKKPMTAGLRILFAKELTTPTKIIDKQIELPPPLSPTIPILTPISKPIITTPTSATITTKAATTKADNRKKLNNKKIEIIDKPEKWDLDKLYNELSIVYDDKMKWGVIRLENKIIIIVFDNLIHPKKQMIVFFDLTYEIRINCRKVFVSGLKENTTIDNVVYNIRVLHKLIPCDGPGGGESPALNCFGYAPVDGLRMRYGHLRCRSCNDLRKKILRKRAYDIKVEKRLHDRIRSLRKTVKLTKAKLKRVKNKYGNKKDIDELLKTDESDNDDFLNISNS